MAGEVSFAIAVDRENRWGLASKGGREDHMVPSMRRVTLRVDPARWRAMQALSKRTGAPIAELARRALNEFMVQRMTAAELRTLRKQQG
jgi:hypothetical protein